MAFDFDNPADKIQYSSDPWNFEADWSYSCWYQYDVGTGYLAGNWLSSAGWYLRRGGPGNYLEIGVQAASGSNTLNTGQPLATDWGHAGVEYEHGGTRRWAIWQDGIEYSSNYSVAGLISGGGAFAIGNRSDNARDFNGRLAEAAAWDVRLSASEWAALNAGISPLLIRPSNLRFYAPLIRDVRELVQGNEGVVTGTTNFPHANIRYRTPAFFWTMPGIAGETQLGVENATLAWSSPDVAVITEEVTLGVDNSALAWTATEVDVATAGTISAELVTLGWTTIDVDVSADGVPLNLDNVLWNFTATQADVLPIEQALDIAASSLAWSATEADVIPAGALALDPVTLGWSSPAATVLSEEQALALEAALLGWSATSAVVLDDANLVTGAPATFGFTSTDTNVVNEQVTGEPLTLGWNSPAANVFVEFESTHAFLVQVVKPVSTQVEVKSAKRSTRTSTT